MDAQTIIDAKARVAKCEMLTELADAVDEQIETYARLSVGVTQLVDRDPEAAAAADLVKVARHLRWRIAHGYY